MREVMWLEEEGEVGIQVALPSNLITLFPKVILGYYTYPCFGWRDSRVRKSLSSSIGLWLGYPLTWTICGITWLGVEVDKDWYSVGNTEYDVLHSGPRILFVWLISFGLCAYLIWFWVTVTFGFSKSSRLRKSCFQLGSMESCQRYPRAWLVFMNVGVVGLAMTDIVLVISTTTPLVTCKWICYNLWGCQRGSLYIGRRRLVP
jgi:hypothetical protein